MILDPRSDYICRIFQSKGTVSEVGARGVQRPKRLQPRDSQTSPRLNRTGAPGLGDAPLRAGERGLLPLLHLWDLRSPGRGQPPPHLSGPEPFLPSLPHYLLPLTSAPTPGAEGGRQERSLEAVGIRSPAAPGGGRSGA